MSPEGIATPMVLFGPHRALRWASEPFFSQVRLAAVLWLVALQIASGLEL